MRRLVVGLLLFVVACKSTPVVISVPANTIIPDPPPSAPLSHWSNASDRSTLSLEADGATLRGWRFSGTNPKAPVLLFFNGNGMTIDGASDLYRQLARLGPTIVAFDYRHYGFSTGQPDLMQYRRDALRLYDFVSSSTPDRRVIVYGFSMGTAIASYVASERPVSALILAAPIATAAEEFPIYARVIGTPTSMINRMKPASEASLIFDETKLVSRSRAPLLVLHGTEDRLVPPNQGREVYENSIATQKKFVAVPGVDHNETVAASTSLRAVAEFVATI